MDDAINLDTLRAEVDRKGSLLSETWTDLYGLLTKYQAQLHVKFDTIRNHDDKDHHRADDRRHEENHVSGESQVLNEAKQEIHRKETLLSKYQIDLIKTTDTLERVKHELRLCQAKLEQVSEAKLRQEEEMQRLKSTAEKREETICQLRGMIYTKETEVVHKSRLLANTAGMYDGAVAKSLQLSSENNLLREELDRQRQIHDDILKQCSCNPSKRRRKLTSPSPMSAPVSNCTSPVNDKPSPPTPTPLTPLTPSPTTPNLPSRELNRSHSLESNRSHSIDSNHEDGQGSKPPQPQQRSSNPSPITTITALSRNAVQRQQSYHRDYQRYEYKPVGKPLASPSSQAPPASPIPSPVRSRPVLSHLPLRSSTPTSEPPVHTPSILATSLTMGGTLGKARKAMAALAKSESREEKEEERSPPQDTSHAPHDPGHAHHESGHAHHEVHSPVEVIPTAPMVMVYNHYRPGQQLATPILHKPAPIFGILPAGTSLPPGTTLSASAALSSAALPHSMALPQTSHVLTHQTSLSSPALPHQTSLNNSSGSSGIGSLSGSSVGGGVAGSNSLCSNSSNSSNSSMETDELREEQKIMMHNGSHILGRLPQTGKTERPRKRCRVCYRSGRRKETPYHCAQCPGKPGLCASPCFLDYHGKIASGEWKDMVEPGGSSLPSPIASPNELDDERSQPIFPKVETEERSNGSKKDMVPKWLCASGSGGAAREGDENGKKTDAVPKWLSAAGREEAPPGREPCDMSLSKRE